jgi:hypothetical protein
MYLRRCLSIGLAAMLLECGIGVSGLERVSPTAPEPQGSVTPMTVDAASADDGGVLFAGDPIDEAGAAAHGSGGRGAIGSEAGIASHVMDAAGSDGTAAAATSFTDAEGVDIVTVGCPDQATCPTGLVCCATFQDGGVTIGLVDSGAIETSCLSSCTAGTTPLCVSDADCGDAGVCLKEPAISARGACAPTGLFP